MGGLQSKTHRKNHRHCLTSPSIGRQELDLAIRIASVRDYVSTFPLTSPAASAIFFNRQDWSRPLGAVALAQVPRPHTIGLMYRQSAP